ncbi:DUF6918 family protein [Prochlorothrix hollandica]|uniref:Uncharacterized protein n=1 Tax=Prochlorothrix hollandica PCC 9006 = CALU 1027 TaxID=317619 RepID=A0A0M2PYZ0_PROHO|nr:hypothetical protein [Prochlorothrix hollandica]KKJ00293.1 hypothetical protein PROH_11475 [Prochlorothrix hollandica PCC 9006 = CALU 1027]
MATLKDILTHPDRRPQVVKDTVVVMEAEVKRQKGLWGIVLGQGFQAVKAIDQGQFLYRAVDTLIGEASLSLDPYYQNYSQLNPQQRPPFPEYLQRYDRAVAEAVLSVTDRRRRISTNPLVGVTYDGLRSQVLPHLQEAVPALGRVIAAHAFPPEPRP